MELVLKKIDVEEFKNIDEVFIKASEKAKKLLFRLKDKIRMIDKVEEEQKKRWEAGIKRSEEDFKMIRSKMTRRPTEE